MAKAKKNRPEKKLVVKVPGDVKKISTLDILKMAIMKSLDGKKAKKSAISQNGIMPDMSRMNDVSTLAIVVDGEVVDVMRAQAKLTSILLANPVFVKVDTSATPIKIGDYYSDGEFVSRLPMELQELSPKEFKLGEKS
jgi:hypothetical protein